jgi:hypothetical protein
MQAKYMFFEQLPAERIASNFNTLKRNAESLRRRIQIIVSVIQLHFNHQYNVA